MAKSLKGRSRPFRARVFVARPRPHRARLTRAATGLSCLNRSWPRCLTRLAAVVTQHVTVNRKVHRFILQGRPKPLTTILPPRGSGLKHAAVPNHPRASFLGRASPPGRSPKSPRIGIGARPAGSHGRSGAGGSCFPDHVLLVSVMGFDVRIPLAVRGGPADHWRRLTGPSEKCQRDGSVGTSAGTGMKLDTGTRRESRRYSSVLDSDLGHHIASWLRPRAATRRYGLISSEADIRPMALLH
jgi:hypothetical protein